MTADLTPTTATPATDTERAAPRAGDLWLASFTLWQREMVRFFRQRNRVIGAFATPLVFWLLLGSGLNRAFTIPAHTGTATHQTLTATPDADPPHDTYAAVGYLEYFYPGTVVLMLLFTAIFSTISVIEDRREGFLQGVLVAPIPRVAIVLGKVLGGASIATIQGVVFLGLWPLVGRWPGLDMAAGAIGVMFLLALGLTALSLCVAWPMDSTAGFHAVMNLFLMPMWFLSGAVFPIDTAPTWMRAIMYANPLTYGQCAFATLLSGGRASAAGLPLSVTVVVLVVFTATAIFLASQLVARARKDGTA